MDQLNVSQSITIISAIAGVCVIFLLFLEKKKNRRLSEQLIQLTTTLEITRKQLDTVQEKHDKIIEFQNSLNVAELTTMLQKPRLNAQSVDTGKTTPGKYSNIQSLAQQGMSVEEIASVLAVSTHEAQQMVNLARLAQGNPTGNDTDI